MKETVKLSSYAKVDPTFFVDGLFVPAANKNKAINIKKKWDGGVVSFRGVQLGVAHQSVLLAICARAGRDGKLVVNANEKDKLIKLMNVKDAAKSEPIAIVSISAADILNDVNLGGSGASYKRLSEYLIDLQTLVVYRGVGNNGGTSNVLGRCEHKGDRFEISLNWRLANAILGKSNNSFIQVSLSERNKLKTPVGKILHAWLCSNVRLGSSLGFGSGVMLDSLMAHVWGDASKVSASALSVRRTRLRGALNDINKLEGWVGQEDENIKDKYSISRPRKIK